METNQEGKSGGKAEKFLSDFGRKLDQFFAEAKDASGKAESDLRKKYAELKSQAEKLKKEANDKERWKEVEANLKKAGEELEKAIASAFKKRS